MPFSLKCERHIGKLLCFRLLQLRSTADFELAVADVDTNYGVAADVAVENGFGEEVYEFLLHESLDRTGAVLRFVTLCTHIVFEFLGEFYCHAVLCQLVLKVADLHLQDLADVRLRKRLEHYDLIDSVQELRTHCPLQYL